MEKVLKVNWIVAGKPFKAGQTIKVGTDVSEEVWKKHVERTGLYPEEQQQDKKKSEESTSESPKPVKKKSKTSKKKTSKKKVQKSDSEEKTDSSEPEVTL